MLKKGRKREAKGLAVLYFIIGLIILLIILAVVYFALVKLDYSDKLDPDATVRPYVENQEPEPFVEEQSTLTSDAVPEYVMPEDEVDLTLGLQEYPEEEPAPVEEEPTPEPTEEPTPEPTAEPTPEPTKLPAALAAKPMTDMPKLPGVGDDNGKLGVTLCYVSEPDDNKMMHIAGYGYVNEDTFDGAQARSWLIVTQVASGQKIAYPLTLTNGISGLTHPDALCQNASACDFEIYLDVGSYQEGIYSLELVIGYVPNGQKNAVFKYFPFNGDISFTILNGQVIAPIATVDYE